MAQGEGAEIPRGFEKMSEVCVSLISHQSYLVFGKRSSVPKTKRNSTDAGKL